MALQNSGQIHCIQQDFDAFPDNPPVKGQQVVCSPENEALFSNVFSLEKSPTKTNDIHLQNEEKSF